MDKSLIRVSLGLFPKEVYSYNSAGHIGKFKNGSLLDFGYCDNQNDVYKYQSAEYDVIRFDELTHFTEEMYIYLMSRVRGANPYPKQIKSSTNPGGVGHQWVKSRFIDIGEPNKYHSFHGGSRVFIPSKIQDNHFLLDADPDYLRRLENLSDNDKKALLYGDWDIFEGQYFSEWNREIHVAEPFQINPSWRKYITLDYGLDMLAAYWIAVDYQKRAYVYKELYQNNLIISDAAKAIKATTGIEQIYATLAPPDLWNRRQETGRSVADIFRENGINLVKTSNDRIDGWMATKEWLKPYDDEQGIKIANLRVFPNCINLIRTIPALQYDKSDPNDVSGEPHELTHAPDAIRGFCVYWARPNHQNKPYQKTMYDVFDIHRNRDDIGKERIVAM